MEHIQEQLEQIQRYAKAALENPKIFGSNEYTGVNWGSLNVCDVCFCQSIDGDCHYDVIIDEVSPDAWEFASYVYEYIKEYAFVDYPVYVITEW
ncbi:MAG: hypothetical protein Tp1111DCM1126091_36 [Prokaryotic dsDNA virus sp.]|nr:MAG: hypothetical protein Tp1111DCM1126091_36 [Prokaryotic dsDNA virus sp.]|tara:strand:+ start:84987 stop:85268 length:282 start_codon:yes stop_codon:yes gene_type:complete